jgi:hypothetical protein
MADAVRSYGAALGETSGTAGFKERYWSTTRI